MSQPLLTISAAVLASHFVDLVRGDHLDEAETTLQKLNDTYPETIDLRIFPVMLAVQRGRVMDALQLLNGMPDDRSPELKALCLRLLNDPTWHAYAEAGLNDPDLNVNRAMRNLLGDSNEANLHHMLK